MQPASSPSALATLAPEQQVWRDPLALMLDSTGEGIYGIDLKGRCVFINKAGASMLGYTPDEVLGRNMHYLMHHSYANRDLMPVWDC